MEQSVSRHHSTARWKPSKLGLISFALNIVLLCYLVFMNDVNFHRSNSVKETIPMNEPTQPSTSSGNSEGTATVGSNVDYMCNLERKALRVKLEGTQATMMKMMESTRISHVAALTSPALATLSSLPNLTNQNSFGSSGPNHVCVVVRTYYKTAPNMLLSLIFSLLNQLHSSLDIFVVDTSGSNVLFYDMTKPDAKAKRKAVVTETLKRAQDPRVHFSDTSTGPETAALFGMDDYGYGATELERRRLLKLTENDPDHCRYFLFTNSDNLYNNQFLSSFSDAFKRGAGFMASDFVHRDPAPGRVIEAVVGANSVDHIDLGAVVISRSVLTEFGFLDAGLKYKARLHNQEPWYFLDGLYFAYATEQFPAKEVVIQHLPLYFHQ